MYGQGLPLPWGPGYRIIRWAIAVPRRWAIAVPRRWAIAVPRKGGNNQVVIEMSAT
jgi:hypothetical protein